MSKPEQVLALLKKNLIVGLVKTGKRIDGRSLDEIRSLEIRTGVVSKAEGSAIVKLGNTQVIAGVKAEVGTPFPDTPNMGVQIVNAELIPLASPVFEAGPPGEEDVELSRVVDRGLRSSGIIDLSKLVMVPGKKVWTIFIDIYALDHDGNLIDAAGQAAVAALITSRIRRHRIEGEEVVLSEERTWLPLGKIPVFVTIAKIGGKLVVDPTYEEEIVMDCRITFAIDEDKNIVGIQKGLAGGLTYGELMEARDLAIKTAETIREVLPQREE